MKTAARRLSDSLRRRRSHPTGSLEPVPEVGTRVRDWWLCYHYGACSPWRRELTCAMPRGRQMSNASLGLPLAVMVDLGALHEWTVYAPAPAESKRLAAWQLRLALVFAGGFTIGLPVFWDHLNTLPAPSTAAVANNICWFVVFTVVLLSMITINTVRLGQRARVHQGREQG